MFARGDSAVVQLTGGEFGAMAGLPRVLDVLDRQNVPATFFIPATAAIVDPQMIPEIIKRKRHEIGVMGWSDENPLAIDNAAEEERLLTKATDYLAKAAGKKPVGARGPSSVPSLHTMRPAEEGRVPLRQHADGDGRALRGAAQRPAVRASWSCRSAGYLDD